MPAIKNGTTDISMNNSGTEASPYSIVSVVTDINDATWISQVNKVITLFKPINWATGFLLIPDDITLVITSTSNLQNATNSATAPTNGLELRGACKIIIAGSIGPFGATVQRGTGTFKCTQKNGIYPTVVQQAGSRTDTFIAVNENLTAANYARVISKIDGLNIQLSNEAHLKWYTSSSNSYQNNINIQRAATGYSGATPTALQLHYGTTLSDTRTSEFAISGDFPEDLKSYLVRPFFDISTASPVKGYFWKGTHIDIVDPKFATGGSWNGQISPDGAGGTGTGIGTRLRWKTTYNASVSKGSTQINNVKFGLFPTKTTTTAVPSGVASEAVANTFVLTSSGKIPEQRLLYKEFFPTDTTAAQESNTTTTWDIYARHPKYSIIFSVQTAAGATSSLSETLSASDNSFCTLTDAQIAATTAPYSGVAFNKTTKTITLTANITTEELYNIIQWWLYQDSQMNLADFSSISGQALNIATWSILGIEFLAPTVKYNKLITTGTVTPTTGSSKLVNLYVEDSTGNTKKIIGVNDIYLRIKDNTDATIVAYAKQTGDVFIRTETAKTYTILARRLGYIQKTINYDASAGDVVVDLSNDSQLLPLGTSTTVAELRAAADALTGYVLADNGDLTFPSGGTLANMYLYASRQQEINVVKTAPEYNGSVMNGARNGSMAVGATLGISGTGTLKLTGTWTGNLYGSVPIEDSAGVRIILTKTNNAAFNIFAVRTDTGAGLGFNENTTSVTYVVPKGTIVKIASWALGYVTFIKTIDTTAGGLASVMEMVANPSINTALDVSSFLANIEVSLATNEYNFTFKAGMSVDLTYMQAIVHRIAGQSASLEAAIAAGSGTVVEILSDEIKINQPIVYLKRAPTLSNTSRVELKGFINTTPATAIAPSYSINPTMTDGTFVVIAFTKPTVDYSLITDYLTESLTDTTKSVTNIEKISSAILGLV